ncbi:MAG: N-acetyltransferase [Candidatus Omnitrophica bacterium]|nr:N-acetyltransferase [Candidatus Omnitrophota bacterium]
MIVKCKLGKRVKIPQRNLVNMYECEVGDDTMIGPFIEIQKGARIGKRCKIESHSFISEGVTIEDDVFIGHGVVFINDKHPKTGKGWKLMHTMVRKGSAIGSNATIMPVVIGAKAMVGAGSVVTKDVPQGAVVAGNPATTLKKRSKRKR